jgi:hypothetical protein
LLRWKLLAQTLQEELYKLRSSGEADLERIQPVILTMPGQRQHGVRDLQEALLGRDGLLPVLVHVDQQAEGAARATQRAIALACRTSPGSPVLLLEDDLEIDVVAAERIATSEFAENVAVISFCDMREVAEYAPDGLYERSALGSDGRGWWGNQALLIHPETAAVLADADWFSTAIEEARGVIVHRVTYDDGGRNCADIRLALIVHAQPYRNRYAVHVPSLFLHVGHDSLCFPGRTLGERATRNWIGHRRQYGIA